MAEDEGSARSGSGWTVKLVLIAVVMVVTGSINTLGAAWADHVKAVGLEDDKHGFNHPFFQACSMFMGEMLCFIGFAASLWYQKYMRRRRDSDESAILGPEEKFQRFNPFIFLPPAMCDMTGTSLMYVGLTLTYASSFQMLRGAVIVFTGLLSVAFLGRKLVCYQWTGIFVIILGLFIVGLADVVSGNTGSNDINGIIAGDLLIIAAQIIIATQMVYEEKFVGKHNVPALLAVGCEGFFGFVVLGLLLIPMYFIILPPRFAKNPHHRMEDPLDAFAQLGNSWEISVATFGNILSIAFFNFAGISVTKEISATTRMVLDSVRTIVIWVVTLSIGWQTFHYLQVIGFTALVTGMCLYYDIFILPFLRSKGWFVWTAPPVEA